MPLLARAFLEAVDNPGAKWMAIFFIVKMNFQKGDEVDEYTSCFRNYTAICHRLQSQGRQFIFNTWYNINQLFWSIGAEKFLIWKFFYPWGRLTHKTTWTQICLPLFLEPAPHWNREQIFDAVK